MRILSKDLVEVMTMDGHTLSVDIKKDATFDGFDSYRIVNKGIAYPIYPEEYNKIRHHRSQIISGKIEIETLRTYGNPHFDEYKLDDLQEIWRRKISIGTFDHYMMVKGSLYQISEYEYYRIEGLFPNVDKTPREDSMSSEPRYVANAIMELEV